MKKIIFIVLSSLLMSISANAYYRTFDGVEIFDNKDLYDKSFNVDTMLFAALASDRVYDDTFDISNYEDSKNFKFYQNNMFELVTYTKAKSIYDLEVSVGLKTYNDKKLIVVSFRGTNFGKKDGLQDILTDIKANDVIGFSEKDLSIKVHSGFWNSEQLFEAGLKSITFKSGQTLFEIIKNAKRNNKTSKKIQFLITGHSLGGAIATLFAARLIDFYNVDPNNIVVYTFGAPAVGNEHFKYVFEDNPNKYKVFKHFYRIRNMYDPVPVATSKKFVNALKLAIATGMAFAQKYKWVAKVLTLKWYYHHIGKLYIFDPADATLHYGKELSKYKLKISDATLSKLGNFSNHKLTDLYIPNIKTYTLTEKEYKHYCYDNYKSIPYVKLKDEYLGNLVNDKSDMSHFITQQINIRDRIDFYRIQIRDRNYCYKKVLNRYYFYNNPKILFAPYLEMKFSSLWFNKLFRHYYFQERLYTKKGLLKLLSFLKDSKFMKGAVESEPISVIGPLKREYIMYFFKRLKNKFPYINIPTIFKKSGETDMEFYDKNIFIGSSVFKGKEYSQYLNPFQLKILLSYFKAANSNKYNKWIVNKESHGYKYCKKKNIDPYDYYLYHKKVNFNINIYVARGITTLNFFNEIYKIVRKAKK